MVWALSLMLLIGAKYHWAPYYSSSLAADMLVQAYKKLILSNESPITQNLSFHPTMDVLLNYP